MGWVLFSQVNNLLTFYFAYLVISFGQGIGGWLALNTLITNWFSKNRSLAIGFANSFARVGPMAIVPILAWLIDPDVSGRPGWSITALVLGIFVIIMSFPLTRLIRNKPEEYGLLPYGDADKDGRPKKSAYESINFTVREALKTRAFWLISIGHGLTAMVLVTFMLHLAPMMTCLLYTSPSPRDRG